MSDIDQKTFNDYCAGVLGDENIDDDAYDPYYNLHELGPVVEQLINLTGEYPQGDILDRNASTWQIWHKFVIDTMPKKEKTESLEPYPFNPLDYEHIINTKWRNRGHTYTLLGIMLTSDDYYWVMIRKGRFNKRTKLFSCACKLETYGFDLKTND